MIDDYSYDEYCEYFESDILYGFGYDSVSDDYKVVKISDFHFAFGPDTISMHVYSLKTNTWRLLVDSVFDYIYSSYSYVGVVVNGFVHWIVKKRSSSCPSPVIVAFNLADEKFSEVPSPEICGDVDIDIFFKRDSRLFVFSEKLAIFVDGEVWLMNEYGKRESWTKVLFHGPDDIQMDEPVVFEDNGYILMADHDRMLVYDVEKRSFGKSVYVWNRTHFNIKGTCVESLVSPKFCITN